MKPLRLLVLSSLSLATAIALSHAPPSLAQTADWVPRCRLQLADDSKPEAAKYLFQTRGKVDGAPARASFDYNSGVSARAAVYPTDAKDLLNPYSNVSVSVGYVALGEGKTNPSVGHMSFRAVGKDFAVIPGAPVMIKVMIDGATFGPFEPKPVSSGMYSVWLDTADTDGDAKPPILNPADFSKLAKAVDAAATIEVVLVSAGADIVRATIPLAQRAAWRDGLSAWAAKTKPGVGVSTFCAGGGEILQ